MWASRSQQTVGQTRAVVAIESLATDLLEELAVVYEDDDSRRQQKFVD